ncbi:MAG: DNA alkylation repair protein [Alistipes sp.]|nr:DNA alkylation repair protein [Alistipes sp.]
MEPTSRMVALLAALRRERNGAVASEMRVFGAPCGLNLGVSLPTVRTIARAELSDHAFARFLLKQDVRELRLAAFHIACPERLSTEELPEWAAGIVNSELAEEAAFALLSRAAILPQLFDEWVCADEPLRVYAALMAAARAAEIRAEWVDPALAALRRIAAAVEDGKKPAYAARLTAQGAVALLSAIGQRDEKNRQAVLRAAGSGGDSPAERFVRDELAWRL